MNEIIQGDCLYDFICSNCGSLTLSEALTPPPKNSVCYPCSKKKQQKGTKNLENIVIQGDSLEVMKTLPAESVDCCITSPPYWGLRDYGTAKWEGGKLDCDHKAPSRFDYALNAGLGPTGKQTQKSNKGSGTVQQYKGVCSDCGAKRQDAQLGLEKTPEEYVVNMVKVFAEVKRVLKKEGTLWLNLGDTYSAQRWTGKGEGQAMNKMKDGHRDINPEKLSGLPDKNLVGIPWRVAFALQADGWYLRQDIIWAKPNPMPESVTDRCTKSHEYIFLMSKNPKYYFDNEAIKEDAKWERWGDQTVEKEQQGTSKWIGNKSKSELQAIGKRNKRSVWTITTKPFSEAHFATFPEDLIVPMIKAGCPPDGIVLDPFMGAGTTGLVARKLQRNYLGIELNPDYIKIAEKRIREFEKQLSML